LNKIFIVSLYIFIHIENNLLHDQFFLKTTTPELNGIRPFNFFPFTVGTNLSAGAKTIIKSKYSVKSKSSLQFSQK
jgi:hypothetical protein